MIEYREHEVDWDDIKVARFWNVIAKNKAIAETYFTKMVGKEVLSDINNSIGLNNKKVLDYGSGPGYLFKHIIDHGYELDYYALEFSEDSVKKIEELYSHHKNFRQAFYVSKFPVSIPQKFDLLICCEVVEHLTEDMLGNFINEAKNLLAKGGQIYITTPNEEPLEMSKVNCPDCGCTFHRWQHVRKWSTESLSSFMEKNGFETIQIKVLNYQEKKSFLLKLKNLFSEKILRRSVNKNNLCYIGKKL